MSDDVEQEEDKGLGFGGTLLLIICISALVFVVILFPAIIASRDVDEARAVHDEIKQTLKFSPEVTVNGIVVVQQEYVTPEVGTVAQRFNHNFNFTYEYFGSTKTITINGTHEAIVGFDLREKFEMRFTGDKALVVLPEPKILSVEPLDEIKFESNSGTWAWENAHDRTKAITAFNTDAEKYAEEEVYPDLKAPIEEVIAKVLANHGKTADFRYRETKTKKLRVKGGRERNEDTEPESEGESEAKAEETESES